MSDRRIFRAEAHERHTSSQERVVLPRFATPWAFIDLWIVVLLLILAGVIIAFWPITALLS